MRRKLGIIAGITALSMALLTGCGNSESVSGNAAGASGNAASQSGTNDTADRAGGQNADGQNTDEQNADGTSAQESGTAAAAVGSSATNTGNLTETGSGYEGIEGTGDYNYGEALQKSLLFYELQRSGDLPETTRCNWRADSCLKDGSDNGVDLTGGWYDAGDNVKFNLPMSYSAAMLGWSIYEDRDAYEESGQLSYALDNIKWANDYFIKCHPSDDIYYYQVGNGGSDHSWWGSAEVIEYEMERPSYYVTKDNPGSTVVAETAASLAVCSIVFQEEDPGYSALCLSHAESLYDFAESTKSDDGYTMAAGFYDSWSGFYDELAWAGAWLYLATEDESYLQKAEEYYPQANQDYDWSMCWDDVHIGAALLLARITEDDQYKDAVEQHLDWWTTGTSNGERITYSPKGLAWLDSWGSLRYATTTAFLAAIYSEWDGCSTDKSTTYWDFAESQIAYALGSTGFSFEIGYGDSYPVHPHHRTSQGSYCDNMNEPAEARHTLYGALVGGPDASDNYTDEVSNYNTNEVACDYNAGFTGALAKMYSKYHGKTLACFGAVEEVSSPEFFVEGGINVEGQDFVEIKAYVYDESAWPARASKDLEMRYFIDLSEVYAEGKTADQIEVTTNYMQSGTAEGLKVWDEENHIYYLSVVFGDGDLYPGGQSEYKCEIQVRMRNPEGSWDNGNDPSFDGLTTGNMIMTPAICLYESGSLIYGTEPAAGENAGQSVLPANGNSSSDTEGNTADSANAQNTSAGNETGSGTANSSAGGVGNAGGSASSDSLQVNMEYTEKGSSGSSLGGTLNIKNTGSGTVSLSNLEIDYYFTKDRDSDLNFSCYHAAITGSGGSYTAVNGTKGTFTAATMTDADTICKITFSDTTQVEADGTLTVNFCINHGDWSNFTFSNDYSGQQVDHIVVRSGNKVIFGEEP